MRNGKRTAEQESALLECWFCEVCATMRLIREAGGRCMLDPQPDCCPLPKLQKPARTQVGKIVKDGLSRTNTAAQ